ncbi:ABC-2 family transporter protein [Saccharopolyspora sp. NPDC050642]|uniref:ABC transporter permease n=1 Tax=Saccharopolyspora sp. NPDC050642 TaxID=3157099 RepID=UPI0033F922BF
MWNGIPAGVRNARRCARIAARMTRLNFVARSHYRGDFLIAIACGVLWQTSVVAFVGVVLSRFTGFGGWTTGALVLSVGMRLLSHGLFVMFFGRITMLGMLVQEGMVESYLTRPLPVLLQVLLSSFSVTSIGDLLAGGAVFAAALVQSDLAWDLGRACYLIACVLSGTLIEAAVHLVIAGWVVRRPQDSGIGLAVDELAGMFGGYPLHVFPLPVAMALTYVVPLAFISYLPAKVLLDAPGGSGVPDWLAAASPLVGPVLFALALALWNRGLRRYRGVGG